MSSTEFTVGLGEGTRVSSKVLRPPGGGSSDIFGLGNPVVASKETSVKDEMKDDTSTHSRVFGVSKVESPGKAALSKVESPVKADLSKVESPVKADLQLKPSPQPCVKNGSTTPAKPAKKVFGEDSSKTPSKPVQTSIRIRNPPGGKSSGIF